MINNFYFTFLHIIFEYCYSTMFWENKIHIVENQKENILYLTSSLSLFRLKEFCIPDTNGVSFS